MKMRDFYEPDVTFWGQFISVKTCCFTTNIYETNYVTLLIFWLLIDVCFLLLHVSFIFDCLVYFVFIILYYVYDFIIKLEVCALCGDADPRRVCRELHFV